MTTIGEMEGELKKNEGRQWAWVFRALWSSASRVSLSPTESDSTSFDLSSRSPCHLKLRIPDTVLFERGEPRKWIGTSPEGMVVRKSFHAADGGIDRHWSSNLHASPEIRRRKRPVNDQLLGRTSGQLVLCSRALEKSEVLQRMDIVQKAFSSFTSFSGILGAPVCVAVHHDGSTELLSDESLRTLSDNHTWRCSLLGLQAYISPAWVATSTYSNQQRHLKRWQGSEEDQNAEGLGLSQPSCPPSADRSDSTSCAHGPIGDTTSVLSSIDTSSDQHRNTGSSIVSGDHPYLALDEATRDVAFAIEMSSARCEEYALRGRKSTACNNSDKSLFQRDVTSRGSTMVNKPCLVGHPDFHHRRPRPKSRVCVRRLQAEFVIDKNSLPWFSKVTQVLVQPITRQVNELRQENDSLEKWKMTREKAELNASLAARELRAVASLAGGHAEEVFRYFDNDKGTGRAGKEEVVRGMASLGVSISGDGALVLINMIAGNKESSRASVDESKSNRQGKHGKCQSATTSHLCMREGNNTSKDTEPRQFLHNYFTASDLSHFVSTPENHTGRERSTSRWTHSDSDDGSRSPHRYPDRARQHVFTARKSYDRVSTFTNRRRIGSGDSPSSVRGGKAEGILHDRNIGTANERDETSRKIDLSSSVSSSCSSRQLQAVLAMGNSLKNGTTPTLSSVSFSESNESSRERTQLNVVGAVSPRDKTEHEMPSIALQGESAIQRTSSVGNDGKRPQADKVMELAYFPSYDPAAEVASRKDRVFHFQRDLVIAYRVLGRLKLAESPLRDRPPGNTPGDDTLNDTGDSSLLVVVPGLFQTLDTIEDAILPLLDAHPSLTVLLMAPPGFPNTRWPAATNLGGKLTAACVCALLEHLLERSELYEACGNSWGKYYRPEGSQDRTRQPAPRDCPPTPDDILSSNGGRPRLEKPLKQNGNYLKDEAFHQAATSSPSVIFVGLGTGANSLLYLVADGLRLPSMSSDLNPSHKTGSEEEDSATVPGVSSPESEAFCGPNGRLTSVLLRHGLSVGGIVLVNGFVSLSEQSCRVLRTLKRALRDQSDGRARAQAVWSLFLSEHHLQSFTGPSILPSVKKYLETRKAFHLDADERSAPRDQRRSMGSAREIAANLLIWSDESDHWQQEQHPRDDEIDAYSEGESEEVKNGLNSDYEGDRSSYRSDKKRRTAQTSRLALAASVAVLDGLVHDPSLGCDPSYLDGVEHSTGGADRPSPTTYLDDEGSALIKAMQYSGIPFVMVQGTEDALVGPPLPLVLQHELPSEVISAANARSVFECLSPPTGGVDGERATRECASSRGPGDGEYDKKQMNSKGMFRVHTCWVKAGHDVLHERKPFLLLLLHKAIYACLGKEPPSAPFLFTLRPRIDDIVANDTDTITVEADGDTASYSFSPTQSISGSRTVTDVTEKGSEDNDGGRGVPRVDCSDDLYHSSNLTTTIVDEGSSRCTSSVEGGTQKPTGAVTVSGTRAASTTRSTAASSSTATTTTATRAPKLLEFYDTADADSCRELREAREYLAKFREFGLEKSVLERGLVGLGDLIDTLSVSAMARYAFQTMKDCWRCKALAVEAARIDLDMQKRQTREREKLAQSMRAVNNLTRTLRKSNKPALGVGATGEGEENPIYLEPLDQQTLKIEIAKAEEKRAISDYACRRLRRAGAVSLSRRERLAASLDDLTRGARETAALLGRVIGHLRKKITLARVQERVFQEERIESERKGLRARRRLKMLERKLELLRPQTQKWVDSDAWHSGYLQRLEAAKLVELLEKERRTLLSVAEDSQKQDDQLKDRVLEVSCQTRKLLSKIEGLGAVFSLLKGALECESFVVDLDVEVGEQNALENDNLGNSGVGENGRLFLHSRNKRTFSSAAERIRLTHHQDRNADEKRWVALDAVLNPQSYHHVTVTEAEEMRWDTLYYTTLTREDIIRVFSLPHEIQLALPFLHTPDEVVAHELLGRYSHGIRAGHFAQIDKLSQDACVIISSTSTSPGGARQTDGGADGDESETLVAAEKGPDSVPWRVISRMRRAAEALVKLPVERSQDEAVWLAIDQRLRPNFYCVEDEATGEQRDDVHNELYAKEDARYAWFRAGEEENAGHAGDHTAMGTIVQRLWADRARATTEEVRARLLSREARVREHEALVRAVVEFVDEAELKRLTRDNKEPKATKPPENTCNSRSCTTKSSKTSIIEERCVPSGNFDAYTGGAVSEGERSQFQLPDSQQTSVTAEFDGLKKFLKMEDQVIREIAQNAISSFYVREEETPVGRNMTRSLAMLQEVALRLGRGQRNVFEGLTRQTAYAALMSPSTLPSCSSSPLNSANADDLAIVGPRAREVTSAAQGQKAVVVSGEGTPGSKTRTGGSRVAEEPRQKDGARSALYSSWEENDRICDILEAGGTSGEFGAKQFKTKNGMSESAPGFDPCTEDELPGGKRSTIVTKASKHRSNETSVVSSRVKAVRTRKIFGSWEDIHPAFLGTDSQAKTFETTREVEEVEVHPASYCRGTGRGHECGDSSMPSLPTDSVTMKIPGTPSDDNSHDHGLGLKDGFSSMHSDPWGVHTGEGYPSSPTGLPHLFGGNNKLVVSGMDKIEDLDPGDVRRRGLLVMSQKRATLLQVGPCELQEGQSKTYSFEVGPYSQCDRGRDIKHRLEALDKDGTTSDSSSAGMEAAVVGIAVTVIFQGHFEKEGYRLGRLAAGLYRMPPKPAAQESQSPGPHDARWRKELPQNLILASESTSIVQAESYHTLPPVYMLLTKPVGFSPHSLQSLNTHGAMGRVMIFHQPRVLPVREGPFQVVIGAASRVRYSVTVTALIAADAYTVFDERLKEAKRLQLRLPALMAKMRALKDASKLARWKQRVIRELLEDAQEEAIRCDGELNEVKRQVKEEGKDGKLDDDGLQTLHSEVHDLSAELRRWKTVFASRSQEDKDVSVGLEDIRGKFKVLGEEFMTLQDRLAQLRKTLPSAAFVLWNLREATDVALKLNASTDLFSGASARWAAVNYLRERSEVVLSPAERVRWTLREEGWNALTIDEQRFTMLDRVLRPDLYTWMEESRIDKAGNIINTLEKVPGCTKSRKDSLETLIGAGTLASTTVKNMETLDEALQARKTQGWSKKVRNYATSKVQSDEGEVAGTSGVPQSSAGLFKARSETLGSGTNARADGTRNTIGARTNLADLWCLPDFSFSAMDLERLQKIPFHLLQRAELRARKLLRRFHNEHPFGGSMRPSDEKLAREHEDRCAAVRAKDPAVRTPEENDWVEIDKKLFPEIWRIKHRQEDRLKQFNKTLVTLPANLKVDTSGRAKNDTNTLDGANTGSGEDTVGEKRDGKWECPFDREAILQIWARDISLAEDQHTTAVISAGGDMERGNAVHWVEDEMDANLEADLDYDVERVRRLLKAFNGPFSYFSREEAARRVRRDSPSKDPLTMTTSQRIDAYISKQHLAGLSASKGRRGGSATATGIRGPGPDAKIAILLHELEAARTTRAKYMDTDVMHSVAQRFRTEHYARELEREIAAQLREQVLERERAIQLEATDAVSDHASVSESTEDDEDENWELEYSSQYSPGDNKIKSPRRRHREGGVSTRGNAPDASWNREGGFGVKQGYGERSPPARVWPLVTMAAKEEAPFGGMEGGEGWRHEELKCNSCWYDSPVVQEFTIEEVMQITLENPSWGGCRACLTFPCRWRSCVDRRLIDARKQEIREEISRLVTSCDAEEVCTTVPLSCVRGGNTTMSRNAAVRELRWELMELDRQLHLADVDKELHDACSTVGDTIEVTSLHSYPTRMWRKDAQVGLEKEREKTLAKTLACEVVDDLLESMLDSWVFGERQAEYGIGGYVPEVKASGPLRPGDRRRAVAYLEHRHRLRRMAHAQGKNLPEEIRGTPHSKAMPVDAIAQRRILDAREDKKKEHQRHLLKETETTMKFGLFCMVQSYLQAMSLVQREKEAWSGKGDVIGQEFDSGNSAGSQQQRVPMTAERKKMIQEEVKARERAAARRNFMERARKAEVHRELCDMENKRRQSQRRAMLVREAKGKDAAAKNIQRVFRGFRGRVFAQRWALKYAEIEVLKYVLHEAATNIQRAYRGHLGRVEASEVRMELAEYISNIRVREAENDLEDYWETHKLEKAKLGVREKVMKTVGARFIAMRRGKLS